MTRDFLPRLLIVALCAGPAAGATDAIRIADPAVRLPPPGQNQTAAYLTLHNVSRNNRDLVRAASPAARVVELHTVVADGGVMKMRPVPKIEIRAGSETRLEPGGLHIMLIGLTRPLRPGETVTLALEFDDGSTRTVIAPVGTAPGDPSASHRHMHH